MRGVTDALRYLTSGLELAGALQVGVQTDQIAALGFGVIEREIRPRAGTDVDFEIAGMLVIS
ncbi:MAG: hypothetical protein ABTR54_15960 [Candidatus Competibacter sp.]